MRWEEASELTLLLSDPKLIAIDYLLYLRASAVKVFITAWLEIPWAMRTKSAHYSRERSYITHQLAFRSKQHWISTSDCCKLALSRDDEEKIISDDYVSTLARRHHRIVWSPIYGDMALVPDQRSVVISQ